MQGRPTSEGRPIRCLVVDDDHDGAKALGDFLAILGADVRVVHSGRESVELGPQFRPLMVILDITMPGIDGVQTCRLLREQSWAANALFVAFTGLPFSKAEAVAAGFDCVVSKGDSAKVFETMLAGLNH
jgi:CheY-like chemotaxis protein